MLEKILEILDKESNKALKENEVPVGCVITKGDKIICKTHNTKQKKHCCVNHAEILAIMKAGKKLKDWRLEDCEMYVTLEPCKMCKEVIKQSRIKKIHYITTSTFNNESNRIVTYSEMSTNYEQKQYYLNKIKKFFEEKR